MTSFGEIWKKIEKSFVVIKKYNLFKFYMTYNSYWFIIYIFPNLHLSGRHEILLYKEMNLL